MKTAVTETSIAAYHAHPVKAGQALEIAAYCERETKAGRLTWIGKIAEHFALLGNRALSQKSTVSARFNEIKERGALIGDRRYRLEKVKEAVPPGGRTPVEMWALVLDLPGKSGQMELF